LKAVRFAFVLAALGLTALGCAMPEHPDPWEKMNRGIFAFNEKVDQYALEPVAKGWNFVVPKVVQTGIDNFYNNLEMPPIFANDLLQAKPKAAVYDLLRFLYNSTFGLAGFIDIATMVQIPNNDEDFGQTLGVWGVPPGPYLVVPFFGPYTVRDGFGEVVETTATAYAYFTPFWYDVVGLNGIQTFGASAGYRGVDLVNLRSIYLKEIAANRADAFDYYVFVRNAYLQNRAARVLDQKDVPVSEDEDLYYPDDADDDEENYDDL
jgi:phospholipid-binding lipoprotein MlaA